MKTVRWLALLALAALLLTPTVALAQDATETPAAPPYGHHGAGPGFMDANGDGVCDNFVDADGDGVCDNCQGSGACTGQGAMQGQGMMRGRGMMQGQGTMQGQGMMARGRAMMQGMMQGRGMHARGAMQGQGMMQGRGPGFVDADGDGVCDHFDAMHPQTAPSGN